MFFFFQAEDGIRDWSVTGVQTCALPIYLGMARDRRRQMGEESEAAAAQTPEQPLEPEEGDNGNGAGEAALSEEQFLDLAAREEFLQSVTEKGFGVRSSAYDYRITGRGGQGVNKMDLSRRPDA